MKENKIEFYGGKLYINGEKVFLLSGDYPYYRDSKDVWEEKLIKIKELGVNMLTFYIPWIHHSKEINGEVKYFFHGEFYDNSNLVYFMDLLKKHNIYCIIKPGPFIHAEVKNGGFPDFILNMDFPPLIKEDGSTINYMGKRLPNPLNLSFQKEVQVWFEQICINILDDYAFPKGNIIAIQIGNEGIYCNANNHIRDFDYSTLGLENYIDYLKNLYVDIDNYNVLHSKNLKSFDELESENMYQCDLDYIDWGKWSNVYMNRFYHDSSFIFKSYKLPILIGLNSPASEGLLSSWLARNYDETGRINFGFTNFLGNAVNSFEVFVQLILVSTLNQWPNLEDNWGHMWEGNEYRYAKTSLYHAMIMLSRGATGYDTYNICATDHTEAHLLYEQFEIDSYAGNPEVYKGIYCAEAPILADAETGDKYRDLFKFVTFIKEYEQELLEAERTPDLAICYCKDTFAIQAGQKSAINLLYQIVESCISSNTDFDILDLENVKKEEMQKYKMIFVYTGKCMPWSTQKTIKDLLTYEELVYIVGDLPAIDEYSRETTCIKNYFRNRGNYNHYISNDLLKVKRLLSLLKEQSEFIPQNDEVYTVLRRVGKVKFIFMINRSNEEQVNECRIENKYLKCKIEEKGFLILRIENDIVSQVYSSNDNTEVYFGMES
ncbi:beta-galactosidase [Anaerosacchariphilus polymeriproducens]|uniref:Uncharacterized protein n=1 Tax=Anaerosacchariphilus polymeriproducens TaxID=1812858 RepID=A0A371ATC7_9FIRM|nr:beta-galactosidase [Anaerosacchariphilus polymeriproducens]RDU22823.1 hypothetical protein DWV06_12815 [Anaerosacchariphilus polymeriproducens]